MCNFVLKPISMDDACAQLIIIISGNCFCINKSKLKNQNQKPITKIIIERLCCSYCHCSVCLSFSSSNCMQWKITWKIAYKWSTIVSYHVSFSFFSNYEQHAACLEFFRMLPHICQFFIIFNHYPSIIHCKMHSI